MPDATTATLAAMLVLEPLLILVVAPRLTRRMVERDAVRIFTGRMLPAIEEAQVRAGVAVAEAVRRGVGEAVSPAVLAATQLSAVLDTAQAQQREDLEAVRGGVRADVEAILTGLRPSPEAMQAAQAQQREALAAIIRAELEAAIAKLDAQEPPALEDAAKTMSQAGNEARATYAAMEEQLRVAVERAAGPAALFALDQLAELSPKTYRLFARKGAAGAMPLLKEAQKLKLPGVQQVPAGYGGIQEAPLL